MRRICLSHHRNRRVSIVEVNHFSTTTPPKYSSIAVFKSLVTDPFFNLAAEEWLFNHFDKDAHVFFYWRNAPSVIIGRFQNPWKECHVQKLEEDKVNLVRRKSGGGAVYQDLGNSIFTFISPRQEFSKERNNRIIINALNVWGIKAIATGRNDITVDGMKISGSAFQHSAEKSLHHGTLLIDVDLNALQRYLNPNKLKLQSKGIASVTQRVVNLCELVPKREQSWSSGGALSDSITTDVIKQALEKKLGESNIGHWPVGKALLDSFLHETNKRTLVQKLTEKTFAEDKYFQKYRKELMDWNWRFGKTPNFTHNLETRFDWGMMDVHLNVEKSIITDVIIYSDCLYPQLIQSLPPHLKGKVYSKEAIEKTGPIIASSILQDANEDSLAAAKVVVEEHLPQFIQWLSCSL